MTHTLPALPSSPLRPARAFSTLALCRIIVAVLPMVGPALNVIGSSCTAACSCRFPNSRLISSVSPHVVRQEAPRGPRYQEGLSYTFLIVSERCKQPLKLLK